MSKIKTDWTMQKLMELGYLYYNMGSSIDDLSTHFSKSTGAIDIQLRKLFSTSLGVNTSIEAWSYLTDNANKHAGKDYLGRKVNTKTIG